MDVGNGEIDYEEFKSIVSNNLTTEDDVKETFCVFDRDESGYIGIEEISLMFSRFGHDLKYEYIEAVTQAANVDGEGTITFKGMLAWSSIKRFCRATRMHSADYAVARCPSVRPSVCLSVTRRY